ncbi:hypothetical protein A3J41_01640 [candidate division TM6 bacterium RIFCSPHIGHO2_12_FULL_38_8]|nr:MAG: hypothetical protein A3J41_01640 [candidate division TM6 bacterium RIFCSPHIGHO2_12_FULL_38_8]
MISAFLLMYAAIELPGSMIGALVWWVPLFMQSRYEKLSFWQGFFWGLIVFGFYLSWLGCMLVQHAGWRGLLVWAMSVVWFSSASGLWFLGTGYSWILSTVLFFLFLTRLSLLPCGVAEGYCLLNPILPFFSSSCDEKIANELIFIQPWWYGNKNPMFVGYRMVDALNDCILQYPNAHAIVMPESTFCFDLHEYEKFISIWSDGLEGKTILLGTHRKFGNGYLNSVVAICDGKIQKVYDKQHLMPFVERVPNCFELLGCAHLFLKSREQAIPQKGDDVFIIGQESYQVFVCSELFFQTKKVKGLPIIFLWNDAWLQFCWTQKLALKFVHYFAWLHGVAVIHASTQGRTNLCRCVQPCK